MRKHLNLEQRLEVLRAADGTRKWSSLDDSRVCIVCDRVFTGRQVKISRDGRGRYLLQCPTEGCPSYVAHWFLVSGASTTGPVVSHGSNGHDSTQAAA